MKTTVGEWLNDPIVVNETFVGKIIVDDWWNWNTVVEMNRAQ